MTTSTQIQKKLTQAEIDVIVERVNRQHSKFWLGSALEDMVIACSPDSPEYLNRLRSIQAGIANFVQIVTAKDIPVTFSSGNMSYTNGKAVVISASLDPEKIDVQVGLALHEASHCLLSNKYLAFLQSAMEKHFKDLVSHTAIIQNGAAIGMDEAKVMKLVANLMNVLEDRRIDLWMYENASGYRPYYKSIYDEYWHSPVIDSALLDPKFRTTSVRNYMMFVINITNQNFDPNALPQLDEIAKIFNLTRDGLMARGDKDIGWDRYRDINGINHNKLPLLFGDAVKIADIILKNSTEESSEGEDEGDQDGDLRPGQGNNPLNKMLPNMDMFPGGGGGQYRRVTAKELEEALNRQLGFLDHTLTDEQKTELSRELVDKLKQLDEAKAQFKSVNGEFIGRGVRAPIILYRDVNKNTVKSNSFPMRYGGAWRGNGNSKNPHSMNALKNGMRIGQVLAARISVIQDESPLKFSRQLTGRIDKRLIASLGFDNENVFHHTMTERKKPVDFWLDIDLSGSMSGDKYERAMTLAVALAYAASKNRAMNVTIATRDSGNTHAHLAIIYDSRKHQFRRLKEILPYMDASGGTPEGLCFEAVKEEILRISKDAKKYFINISDGEPNHGFQWKGRQYSYGGEPAFKHTRAMMKEFEAAGITVMSYFVGNTVYEHPGFKRMYGDAAQFIDVKSITGIVRTVNRLMVSNAK